MMMSVTLRPDGWQAASFGLRFVSGGSGMERVVQDQAVPRQPVVVGVTDSLADGTIRPCQRWVRPG